MADITNAELKNKLRGIEKLKFVPMHRIGNTGIGKTLEDPFFASSIAALINLSI